MHKVASLYKAVVLLYVSDRRLSTPSYFLSFFLSFLASRGMGKKNKIKLAFTNTIHVVYQVVYISSKMKYRHTAQLAKLSFNHSIGLTHG